MIKTSQPCCVSDGGFSGLAIHLSAGTFSGVVVGGGRWVGCFSKLIKFVLEDEGWTWSEER